LDQKFFPRRSIGCGGCRSTRQESSLQFASVKSFKEVAVRPTRPARFLFDRQPGCAAHQVAARFDQHDEAQDGVDELENRIANRCGAIAVYLLRSTQYQIFNYGVV